MNQIKTKKINTLSKNPKRIPIANTLAPVMYDLNLAHFLGIETAILLGQIERKVRLANVAVFPSVVDDKTLYNLSIDDTHHFTALNEKQIKKAFSVLKKNKIIKICNQTDGNYYYFYSYENFQKVADQILELFRREENDYDL